MLHSPPTIPECALYGVVGGFSALVIGAVAWIAIDSAARAAERRRKCRKGKESD